MSPIRNHRLLFTPSDHKWTAQYRCKCPQDASSVHLTSSHHIQRCSWPRMATFLSSVYSCPRSPLVSSTKQEATTTGRLNNTLSGFNVVHCNANYMFGLRYLPVLAADVCVHTVNYFGKQTISVLYFRLISRPSGRWGIYLKTGTSSWLQGGQETYIYGNSE